MWKLFGDGSLEDIYGLLSFFVGVCVTTKFSKLGALELIGSGFVIAIIQFVV